jgi:hypothetical protein
MGFSKKNDSSKLMRQEEEKRQARISTGMTSIDQAFAGYNPDYYNQRAQAFQSYAMPMVADKYQQAAGGLETSLARRGLRKSMVADRFYSALNRENATQRRSVVDQAQAHANQLRQQVEESRGNITNQLYASAEPQQAKLDSLAAASRFTAPSMMTPVVDGLDTWARNNVQIKLGQQVGFGGEGRTNYSMPMSSSGASWSFNK